MPSIEKILESNRRELLDLSTRNRLLSMPDQKSSARVIRGVNEPSDRLFGRLLVEKRELRFVGIASKTANLDEEVVEDMPEEDSEASPTARPSANAKIQTALTAEALQARLLTLYRDARTLEEEQGVNILYLALGALKWFESDASDIPRYAPLILVPVQLRRESVRDGFKLRWREEDVQENLSLGAKLKNDFGITLPDFPADEAELIPSRYADSVRKHIGDRKKWAVEADTVVLGFFSFAKFLMYRDLDPQSWPNASGLLSNPFINGLLRDGFPSADSPFSDDGPLDDLIPAARLDHVVDADSSQTVAIERVRAGQNLVIQGPPGTGKSQSIINLIASAVLDGKKVLFVAEKLAALEVVKRRMEEVGLGDVCLELHSHKAQKRLVLQELGRTWKLGSPLEVPRFQSLIPKLAEARDQLNGHVRILHTPLVPSGLSPFVIMGRLTELGEIKHRLCFEGAEDWNIEDRERRTRLVAELAKRAEQVGEPGKSSWKGVRRSSVLAIDLPVIAASSHECLTALKTLRAVAAKLASALNFAEPQNFSEAESLRRIGDHLAKVPSLDFVSLEHEVWKASLDSLRKLIDTGRVAKAAKVGLSGRVSESSWSVDLRRVRSSVAAHGRSVFRLFSRDYHRSEASLRNVFIEPVPTTHADRLAVLDAIIAFQKHLTALQDGDELGRSAFGSHWHGADSDWDNLADIVSWVENESRLGLDSRIRSTVVPVSARQALMSHAIELGEGIAAGWNGLEKVLSELRVDIETAFDGLAKEIIPFTSYEDKLAVWHSRPEELSHWCAYELCATRAREVGLGSLVSLLESEVILSSALSDTFASAYFVQLLREAVRQSPEIAQFHGSSHNERVAAFQFIDRDRLNLARHDVLKSHHAGLPMRGAGIGATGIVLAEIEKKRNHRSIRRLIQEASTVVQAIKPVFMMSPLSVAQYLAPGAATFDLLIIDEASQVQPVDAMGAVARARQIVVVGDSRQLPPSRFFAQLTSDEPEENDESEPLPATAAKDTESILSLCLARGISDTMLRWHYRSRHHSLIAVSNQLFYDSRLFIVPSPEPIGDGLGLQFTFVPDGVFDSGGTSSNQVEARAVSAAVLQHARCFPNLSLGVAAFSVRQQQAILDEVELLRRANPDTDVFFNQHPHEPFFIKNLENVQGDERDVILISVGYGKNQSGYMAMRFGPLSSEGGERRLNVLISRAKCRCEVFASITADDIDLARGKGAGVAGLKTFLKFAQSGILTGLIAPSGGQEQSPFEEAVRRAIESFGYDVHPQVGTAGFWIDLGIVDPVQPGRYLLGIECDGASYHASRSARDRDRLRQTVLEHHGWQIYRIWSTDWFQTPNEQKAKLGVAIEEAKLKRRESRAPTVVVAEDVMSRNEYNPAESDPIADLSPYLEAKFNVGERPPQELAPFEMARVLAKIVEVESPIHEEELVARVRDLWGLGRAGKLTQNSVKKGIKLLLQWEDYVGEEGCILIRGRAVVVRSRVNASSASLRKPEFLPGPEIREAIKRTVEAHHQLTRDELAAHVARLFGFRAGAVLKERVLAELQKLSQSGELVQSG